MGQSVRRPTAAGPHRSLQFAVAVQGSDRSARPEPDADADGAVGLSELRPYRYPRGGERVPLVWFPSAGRGMDLKRLRDEPA